MNLSKPQKLIYDMDRFAGGTISVICGSLLFPQKLDADILSGAINRLFEINDALRIRIFDQDGRPTQKFTDYSAKKHETFTFSSQDELDRYGERYAKEPIDLFGDLCQIKIVLLPEQSGVMIKLHHIIGDAWTLSLLGRQLSSILNGEEPEAYSYADYIASESEYSQSKRYIRDRQYFIDRFSKCEESTFLCEKQSRSYSSSRRTFVIENGDVKKIQAYIAQNGTTVFSLFTAALAAYMNRVKMNAEKFYVGTAVLNRGTVKEKNTAGMFINTVPMLIELDNNKSFSENLTAVQESAMSVLRHQKFHYGELLETLRAEQGFTEKLYDVIISYQNAALDGTVRSRWYHCGEQTESLQIHIDDRDNEGIFRVHFDYQTEKFTEYDIENLYDRLMNLLFSAIADDNKKIQELTILSPVEECRLLHEFNDTAEKYSQDKCVHQLFEEQAEKTPDKLAVIACDRTLTYRELNEQANRIAHSLIQEGIKTGDIVAFALPRKSYMLAVMFGILKTGAAYLPVDPDYPKDRIEYILEDSKAKQFIREDNIAHFLSEPNPENVVCSTSSTTACYNIYTSGSTGKPKAVTICHKNVSNFCASNLTNSFQKAMVECCEYVLAINNSVFDITLQELFLPLLNGLTVVLSDSTADPEKIGEYMAYEKSGLIVTPSKLTMLLENESFAKKLDNVSLIMIGAEVLSDALVAKVKMHTNAYIINGYGPTETTCGCTYAFVDGGYSCVHHLFEEQAEKMPDKLAVIACDRMLTYRELNEQANRIAHGLIQKAVKSGDIVAIKLSRKSYLIAAMFGVMKTGAAFLPLDPEYPQERIDYLTNEAKAVFCIDEDNVLELLENTCTLNPEITNTESVIFCALHTSGSTGRPKLALLTHKGILNFSKANARFFDGVNATISATIVTFDAFIQDTVISILNGVCCVLGSEKQIYDQIEFEKLFESYDQVMFFSTPTKLRNYIRNSQDRSFLKKTKSLIVGGEVFDKELYEMCSAQNKNVRIYNGYGPTETTCGVTYSMISSEQRNIFNIYGPTECSICATTSALDSDIDISIGKPIANTQIYIVDKYMHIVPIGVTGELCIAGDGVGAGYLNRPELSAEKFIDNPFGNGKLYKTGDLAYWREDGNIMYVGRNDFQVKIRGLRIELGEIENAVSSVEDISQTAVVVRKNSEGRQLICAFYTGKETEAKEIRAQIGKRLPKYMLPHIFTHLHEMPLTPSGKVNRKALPEVNLENITSDTEYVPPKTDAEIALVNAMQAVLKVEKVSILDNFFDLGGDSLKSIELISHLQKIGYGTETKTVFECDTIKELAERLTCYSATDIITELIGDIPASAAQMRVYTAQNVNTGSTTYNVPYAFRVSALNAEKLQKAVDGLVERHEALRTHFENRDGQIIQVTDPFAKCTVEALSSEDISAFIRPFNLSAAPLMRVGYYKNTIMLDMHHIITDGGSMPVILRELNELYMGRKLSTQPAQYRQFAMETHDLTEDEAYWLSVYKEDLPILELNTDRKRPQKQSFNGSVAYDTVDIDLHQRILAKCRQMNITPFVFYMGAFQTLLSKFSGNEDIIVGMPISGRGTRYLDTVGMFVNTVALRSQPEGTKTIASYLQEVKQNSVLAIQHQAYPYGTLVKKLGLQSENRNPLFDVMFAYQSEQMTDVVFCDEKAELLPVPIFTSKYDFTFNVMPREMDVVLMAEYSTDLYDAKTIHRMLESYKSILNQLLNTDVLLKNITVLSPAEESRLLYEFNDTAEDYPQDKCVHRLFEEQAAKTPDKLAVIACDRTLTYRELNEQANRIAHSLIREGIMTGDIVAFVLPRKSCLLATMLGILKSGATYLPIDPDYPKDRIDYMVSDSGAKLLITEEVAEIYLQTDCDENPGIPLTGEEGCYCIYTSGSTGKPKGVVLRHRNVVNYSNVNQKNIVHYCIKNNCESIVSVTTCGFDIFVTESLMPLANGLRIVLANEDQSKLPGSLNELLKRIPADVLQTTPSKMKTLISDETQLDYLKTLKVIILGGEALDALLLQRIKALTSAQVFNIYGPTETTVWSTVTNATNCVDGIPIGKPIANTQIYIVDKYMHIVPIGVTGELCIAGDGVGAGYLNRPELTAEKFIDNPFGNGKLYKTGDLAYWRKDGNIMYVGRNDFQVKIRGLRIELGEIENAVSSVEGISQTVVVVRKNSEGRQLICAFYTGEETEAKEIRAQIGKRLPKYMLPHIFTHLSEMPLTPSGKVNRKALPEVDLENISSDTEYVPPKTELQKALCRLMEAVLGTTPVGLQDDFFELGGDSLKAIEFVSKAHHDGIYFALQNVFDYPTAEKLGEMIENGNAESVSFDAAEFDSVSRLLSHNTVEFLKTPEPVPVGNLLLAGATGFLGIHILADYLEHENGIAYCIVRGKSPEESNARMQQMLEFYFPGRYTNDPRIHVLCADLQGDHLGLNKEEYDIIRGKISTVINCAASVKHYGAYQFFYDANVKTVKNLISFCRDSGAKLIHTSTLSISGNSFGDDFNGYISQEEKEFAETNFYIGQPLDNVYARSKFEAEKAVYDAIAEGLIANVMRMGNLTNRQSDGVFQKNYETNAFLKRVRAVLELGMVPDYLMNLYAEFTPIDEAARAVMTLTEHFSTEQTVFHINSPQVVYLDRLTEFLPTVGFPIQVVDGTKFTDLLRQTVTQNGNQTIYETFINDLDQNDRLNYDSNIHIRNDFTIQYLRNLGFEWQEIDDRYLRNYIAYFRKIGFFEGRNNEE